MTAIPNDEALAAATKSFLILSGCTNLRGSPVGTGLDWGTRFTERLALVSAKFF
jgi:hypothetical protein